MCSNWWKWLPYCTSLDTKSPWPLKVARDHITNRPRSISLHPICKYLHRTSSLILMSSFELIYILEHGSNLIHCIGLFWIEDWIWSHLSHWCVGRTRSLVAFPELIYFIHFLCTVIPFYLGTSCQSQGLAAV